MGEQRRQGQDELMIEIHCLFKDAPQRRSIRTTVTATLVLHNQSAAHGKREARHAGGSSKEEAERDDCLHGGL